jgi:hypothetical protein
MSFLKGVFLLTLSEFKIPKGFFLKQVWVLAACLPTGRRSGVEYLI